MGDEKIREGLLQAGWSISSVEEAMMKAPAVAVLRSRSGAMMSKSLAIIFIIAGLAVGGYFASAYYMANYQSFFLWPFEVSILFPTASELQNRGSSISQPSPSSGEIGTPFTPPSDWQIYRNEEYGFEVKYPRDWGISDTTSAKATFIQGRSLNAPDVVSSVFVEIFDNSQKLPVRDWYLNQLCNQEFSGSTTNGCNVSADQIKNIEINHYPGIEITTPWLGYTNQRAFFSKNNFAIRIFTQSIESGQINPYFNQILSTFKFIEL